MRRACFLLYESGLVAVAVAVAARRAGANADANTASGAASITDAHASRVRGRHAEPDRNAAVRTVHRAADAKADRGVASRSRAKARPGRDARRRRRSAEGD